VRDHLTGRRTFALLLAMLVWCVSEASVAQEAPQADRMPDISLWNAAGIVRVSRPADPPPLALSDLSGHLVDLRQLRGQVVLVYFWATW
jgi:cytochrome oxidase Cu insertion factor (SCO1/SenC/PrrC family)